MNHVGKYMWKDLAEGGQGQREVKVTLRSRVQKAGGQGSIHRIKGGAGLRGKVTPHLLTSPS